MKKRFQQYQDYIFRLFPEAFYDNGKQKPKDEVLCKTVTFQVTDACNLKCSYCYQINKGKNKMSLEVAKKTVDMLLDGNEYINVEHSPAIIIEFIGGEPLLEIELIDQITDYFILETIRRNHPWQNRFALSICSNGLLYFDEQVQRYLKKHRNRLSFTITIDGNKELHDSCRLQHDGTGSYDIAVAGALDYMQKISKNMGSKVTLCPENVAHTFEAVVNLIKLGYSDIAMNCIYENGWELHHAKILYEQMKLLSDYILENNLDDEIYITMYDGDMLGKPQAEDDVRNWCGGTGNMLAIDYRGDLYPCLRYMESSLGNEREPLVIGNIYDGIGCTPEQSKCISCLKSINRKTQSTEECFKCPISAGCAWCSAYNYQIFGTANKRATNICDMHKARVLANLYYWNKLIVKTGEGNIFYNHVPDEWALEIIDEKELCMLKELQAQAEKIKEEKQC